MKEFNLQAALAGKQVIWKEVVGFPEYIVSNTGIVKSLQLKVKNNLTGGFSVRKERIKSQRLNFFKYYTVSLCRNYKSYTKLVHRLVAESFIPNPLNKKEVNHKDGNKLNNCVENLEWVTRAENAQHAVLNGLMKSFSRKLSKEDVDFIRSNLHLSSRILAKMYNVSRTTIKNLRNKKTYNATI